MNIHDVGGRVDGKIFVCLFVCRLFNFSSQHFRHKYRYRRFSINESEGSVGGAMSNLILNKNKIGYRWIQCSVSEY